MNKNVRTMVQCSLFAALTAVCAWLSIPMPPVFFTLQTFAVLLALGTLGGRNGCVSIMLYLLLGAVGLPVFAGFRGGIGILLGPTGGFLWGFLAAGLVYRLVQRLGRLPAMIAAQVTAYGCGCLWFSLTGGVGFFPALLTCVIPYLIPDAGKLGLAWVLSRRLARFRS